MEAADKWRAKAIQKYPEYAELVDYPFYLKSLSKFRLRIESKW